MSNNKGHAVLAHVTITSTMVARPAVVEAIAVTKALAVFHNGTSTTAAVLALKATTSQNTVLLTFPNGVMFSDRVSVT